jgi:hypothetical protein
VRKIIAGLLLFLIGVNILYVISGALHFPITSIDALGIWLFKAKGWYLAGSFPLELLQDHANIRSHPHYPVLWPFLLSRTYFLTGMVNEQVVAAFYPLLYVACLVVGFLTLRKLKFSYLFSLLCMYVYSMLSPLLAQGGRGHAGDADIVITLLIWILVWLIVSLDGVTSKAAWKYWSLIPIIMVASQIKAEGTFLVLMLWWLPLPKYQRLSMMGLAILPALFWQWYRIANSIPADFFFRYFTPLQLILRLVIVLNGTLQEMLNWRNWYYFWPLFLMALVFGEMKNKLTKDIILPSLLSISLCFGGVYLFATVDTWAYVTSSVDRIMLQLSPLWFLIFVEYCHSIFYQLSLRSRTHK